MASSLRNLPRCNRWRDKSTPQAVDLQPISTHITGLDQLTDRLGSSRAAEINDLFTTAVKDWNLPWADHDAMFGPACTVVDTNNDGFLSKEGVTELLHKLPPLATLGGLLLITEVDPSQLDEDQVTPLHAFNSLPHVAAFH